MYKVNNDAKMVVAGKNATTIYLCNYRLCPKWVAEAEQKLLFGSEWNDYFRNTYGSNNVKWYSNRIRQNEITTYADFAKRSVKGDGLEGHELWQYANINENGYANQRLVGEASRNKPFIALPHEVHVEVNSAQGAINARGQTPLANNDANKDILLNNPQIPNTNIYDLYNKI